jgi:potassium channel subfamily K
MPADEEAPLLSANVNLSVKRKQVDDALTTIKKPHTWGWKLRVTFCILWIAFGVLSAHFIEGWDLLTAGYVIVQIVTTVGYGDVTVSSQSMRFFCTIYVLVTLCFVAALMMDLMDQYMQSNTEMVKASLRSAEAKHVSSIHDADEAKKAFGKYNAALASAVPFLLFVAGGTIFFRLFEPCVCSYGSRRIEGCVDGAECYNTGGDVKTWVDSFYMSVITLTTVGFGDETPKSFIGTVGSCAWMIVGVAATAAFLGNIGTLVMDYKHESLKMDRVSEDIFRKIDKDNSGTLSREEFQVYALLKYGLVDEDDLDNVNKLFNHIDKDKSESLTYAEIQEACD